MKVCMISDLYYPDNIGGTETNLRTISEALTINNNVIVICSKRNNKEDGIENINGVQVYRIDIGNIYSIFDYTNKPFYLKPIWHLISLYNHQSYLNIKRILEKEHPDIIHTHNLHALSPLVFYAIKELKIPHIHELHDYGLICPRTNLLHGSSKICYNPNVICKLYIKFKRYMVKDPQLIIGPSQFIIEKHLEHGFFSNTKHLKLIHGVKIPDTMLKKYYDFIDILYVGQLLKHKGVHILIEAFKKIQREDIRLHICGRGKYEVFFRNLAKEDNRIKFYGYISEIELNHLYEIANVLVVPSLWYDNSPTVIYEAFAHGTPVIGSRIGGISELVHDGENGFLYEPGNQEQLIKIIENLFAPTLIRLEKNILKLKGQYTIDIYITKLKYIYNRLLLGF